MGLLRPLRQVKCHCSTGMPGGNCRLQFLKIAYFIDKPRAIGSDRKRLEGKDEAPNAHADCGHFRSNRWSSQDAGRKRRPSHFCPLRSLNSVHKDTLPAALSERQTQSYLCGKPK